VKSVVSPRVPGESVHPRLQSGGPLNFTVRRLFGLRPHLVYTSLVEAHHDDQGHDSESALAARLVGHPYGSCV
jgi:hypothetical protein